MWRGVGSDGRKSHRDPVWTAVNPPGPKVDPEAHFLNVWEFRKVEGLLKGPVVMIYVGGSISISVSRAGIS